MKKKFNIKDIAKETGFSMMTVSRALSNPEKVSKSKSSNKDFNILYPLSKVGGKVSSSL